MANVEADTIDANTEILTDEEINKELKGRSFVRNIFHNIWVIVQIPIFLFVWVFKEFIRLWHFLSGGKQKKDEPLNYEEIAFIESIPLFLIMTGIVISILIGVLAWFGGFKDSLDQFFESTTDYFRWIGDIIKGTLDFFWGLIIGLIDLISGIFIGLYDFFGGIIAGDPLLLTIIVVILIFAGVILVLAFSELSIHRTILRRLGYLGLGLSELPRAFYNSLNNYWIKILKKVGRRLVGGKIITQRSRGFYQRVVLLVIIDAIWTFLWGILLLLNELVNEGTGNFFTDSTTLFNATLYLLAVLLISGVVAGSLLMFVLVKLLNRISHEKYTPTEKAIATARHQSLLDYLTPKSKKYFTIERSLLSLIVDIPDSELDSHWPDSSLKNWKLYSTHVVNQPLFDQRIEKVDIWEDEGLEKGNIHTLIKAFDYLAHIQKKFGNVPEIENQLTERIKFLTEDIGELRAELLADSNVYMSSYQLHSDSAKVEE